MPTLTKSMAARMRNERVEMDHRTSHPGTTGPACSHPYDKGFIALESDPRRRD